MHSLTPETAFMLGILAGWVALGLLGGAFWLAKPWLMAAMSGSRIPLPHVLGMRLRGTPPMVLIPAYIAFRKRGIDIDLNALEAAYLAHGSAVGSSDDLIRIAERTLLKPDEDRNAATR